MIPKNRITNILLFVILTSLLPLFGFGQQDASIGNQIKTSIKEPHGTISITYDNGNNFWCLTKGGEIGYNLLMVLPSEGAAWEQEELSGVDLELWHTVLADEQGILWLASSEKLVFADLRNLSRGWTDIRAITDFPTGDITALITGSNGSALVGLVSGNLVETKLKKITEGEESYYIPSILVHKIPIGLMALNIDKEGNVDCKTEKETVTMDLGSSWMEN
jgi:hypothetical protein